VSTPKVICNDARTVLPTLPDGAFDWIVTDPPYTPTSHYCYLLLGEEAPRLLADGGWLVVYAGKMYLDQVMAALGRSLRWFWLFAERHEHQWPRIFSRRILQRSKPVLIFTKGKPRRMAWMADEIEAPVAKSRHPWEQAIDLPLLLFQKLARPGEWVLDPFCGTGTTLVAAQMAGLRAVGIDCDAEAVKVARARLQGVKPCPLLAAGSRRTNAHWLGLAAAKER